MAGTKQNAKVGGRELTFSNLEKVLWPRDGYTKGDLIDYYRGVSKWILPYLKDRPLTLQRYPDGIDRQSFFEKQAPKFTPEWIPQIALSAEQQTRKVSYILCNDEATLAWCANLASVVLHVWYSHVPTVDKPDYLLFDLDTCERTTIKTLAAVALAFRDALELIKLPCLVKTTGGSGLHIAIPLQPKYDYDTVKRLGEIVARHIAAQLPDLTTLERAIAKRPNTAVYLDWVQVGRGKTVVPPYGVRARDGAPVSTPLAWDEVESLAKKRTTPEATFAQWNISNISKRLAREGDMWGRTHWKPAAIEPALRAAQSAWA